MPPHNMIAWWAVPPASTSTAYFGFRTISSAEVLRVGERYYLFYEEVRGPGPGDQGDTQFLLGLARSTTATIDGPWELFPGNPLLINLPGNVGVVLAEIGSAGRTDPLLFNQFSDGRGYSVSRCPIKRAAIHGGCIPL